MSKGDERRRTVRIVLALPVSFTSRDLPTENAKGALVDLSIGGVALETQAELQVGENLDLRVDLPNQHAFDFTGQVVRESKSQSGKTFGVKITKMNMLDRMKLGEYICIQMMEQTYLLRKYISGKGPAGNA